MMANRLRFELERSNYLMDSRDPNSKISKEAAERFLRALAGGKATAKSAASVSTSDSGRHEISHKLYYHFSDHLGSSNIVTDEAGNVVEVSDYLPYGQVRVRQPFESGFSTRKQFTGKEKDGSSLYSRSFSMGLAIFVNFEPNSCIISPKTCSENGSKVFATGFCRSVETKSE